MTRIRKDLDILGFKVEGFLKRRDYHKNCLPQEEDWQGRVIGYITEETLEKVHRS